MEKTDIIDNFLSEEALEQVISLLNENEPFWFGRHGGSDADFVLGTDLTDVDNGHFKYLYSVLCNYNGYFDKGVNIGNLIRFKQEYMKSCKSMDIMMIGATLDSYPTCVNPRDSEKFEGLQAYNPKTAICWGFLEHLVPFVKLIQRIGVNKKVLVVSPFSESIKFQTQPDRLPTLRNSETLKFPEGISFSTVTSPITYNTPKDNWQSNDLKELPNHLNNWFDVSEDLFNKVKNVDFDLALLACGSYSHYLGHRIKGLNKSAIYVGSILNSFFSIYNQRCKGYDSKIVNKESQITAFEHSKHITPDVKSKFDVSEGLNAYFGEKPND